MNRQIFGLVLVIVALTSMVTAQYQCTFELSAPTLDPNQKIYITGGHDDLGNWNANAIEMQNEGNNRWSYIIQLDETKSIEYKYTLGDWEHTIADANGNVVPNLIVTIDRKMAVSDVIHHWTSESPSRPKISTILGKIETYQDFTYDGILPRNVHVWLPQNYQHTKEKFGVLYMHDAQNIFDEATSSFGVEWRVDEIIDSLMRAGKMKGLIVVGIDNTKDRFEEYSYGEKGHKYMEFIVKKLKPIIDKNYRTKAGKKHTFTAGASMGGLISLMLAWEHSDVFSKAICMSPALQIRELNYVEYITSSKKPEAIKLYIDNGGIGLEEELQPGIDSAIEVLQTKGFKMGKNLIYVRDKSATHSELAWSKRLPEALMFLEKIKL